MRRLLLAIALLLTPAFLVAQTPPTTSTSNTCANPTRPQAVHTPDPEPPFSWAGHGPRQATSIIGITIDEKGRVRNPNVVKSGGKEADAEALSAVRRWKFKPATCDGKSVEAKINVEVTITLR